VLKKFEGKKGAIIVNTFYWIAVAGFIAKPPQHTKK